MSTESTQMSEMPNELQKSWRYLMGVGILIAVLGILAILAPFVTGIAITVVLGALLVIGALGHVAHAFSARGWKGSVWQIVLAVVYAFAGISLIANPVIGLATLTILVIAFFLAEGVVEIVAGFVIRPEPRWGWIVASGVISLLVAGLLWIGFPSTAVWAIGLLFGVNLLSTGLSLVFVANKGRKTVPMPSEEMPGAGSPGV